MNQAYLANYSSNGTDVMGGYDGASAITFSILHGFKASNNATAVWEETADYHAVTGGSYANADLGKWKMFSITADLLAHGLVKFKFTDGTDTFETPEFNLDGLTTLRLWIKITDLTTDAGYDIFAQAI
jgi:hypothetical protein